MMLMMLIMLIFDDIDNIDDDYDVDDDSQDVDEIEVADNAEKGPLPKKKAEPKRTSLKKPVRCASENGPKKKTNIISGKPANP